MDEKEYIECINQDSSFKDFALKCAEDLKKARNKEYTIKENEKAIIFNRNRALEIKKELDELNNMTDEEIQKRITENFESKLQQRNYVNDTMISSKQKYEKLLKYAEMWQPPTSDYNELKDFIIKKIQTLMDDTCNKHYFWNEYVETPESVYDYKINRLKSLTLNLKYHETVCISRKNVINKLQHFDEWFKKLKTSLECHS